MAITRLFILLGRVVDGDTIDFRLTVGSANHTIDVARFSAFSARTFSSSTDYEAPASNAESPPPYAGESRTIPFVQLRRPLPQHNQVVSPPWSRAPGGLVGFNSLGVNERASRSRTERALYGAGRRTGRLTMTAMIPPSLTQHGSAPGCSAEHVVIHWLSKGSDSSPTRSASVRRSFAPEQ